MILTKFLFKATVIAIFTGFTSTTLTAQGTSLRGVGHEQPLKGNHPYSEMDRNSNKVGWFLNLNGGIRMFGAVSDAAILGTNFSGNGGIGYFFSDGFGIKGRMDYNRFSFSPGIGAELEAQGEAMSFSLEAMTNLLALSPQQAKFRDYRITLHGGLGYTSYINRSYRDDRLDADPDYFEDGVIKGSDDMIHAIIGITPQCHISPRWSVNLDFSSFFLFKQDFTFDHYNGEHFDEIGYISNLTVGITFRP